MLKELHLESPVAGKLIPLSEVNDPVFSSGMMGRGCAVREPGGIITAPFDGTVSAFTDTNHAIGLHSDDGVDILIHIGLDTVNLGGKGFTAFVSQGDKISKGQKLIGFAVSLIKDAGYDITTPVVVTNDADYSSITITYEGQSITSKV